MSLRSKSQNWLLSAALVPLLTIAFWFGIKVKELSNERAAIRRDYSVVNDIRFGVLSVTAWRDEISLIISERINMFTLSAEQQEKLNSEVTDVLNAILTKADSIVQNDRNSVGKKIRRVAVNAFVNWDDLRKRVPEFSKSIVDEINKPENIDTLKTIARQKLGEFSGATRDTLSDTIRVVKRLAKYEATDREDFNAKAADLISSLQEQTYRNVYGMVAVMIVFILLWFFVFRRHTMSKILFALSVLLALIVLVSALTSPMIEIDARITKMEFLILGEHIRFNDQVLFYQSKSILQVVDILLKTGKADSMFVGILILLFSVLFPTTKLVSTAIFLLGSEKIKRNVIISFFAFKSAKWSMADVMVVAIFMAYVGFKGILTSQLEHINIRTPEFTSIATNLTSLQPGFILFLAFVIYSFLLSEILKRMQHERRAA